MKESVQVFNKFMPIIRESNCWITDQQCQTARAALDELLKTWRYTRGVFDNKSSLGAKYHHPCIVLTSRH